MPELPEVETLRADLAAEVTGERIESVEASGARTLRRHLAGRADFEARVAGQTIASLGRRGKYLVVGLERPEGGSLDRAARHEAGDLLVVHLRMSGQLLLADPVTKRPPHAHVVLGLASGRELRFVDPRTFGEVVVVAADEVAEVIPSLAGLGPDPLLDVVTDASLAMALRSRRVRLKTLLCDQRFLAGLGNIYSDEVLWAANLSGARRSDSLTDLEVHRLRRALAAVLADAVRLRGSSLADQQYRDLWGRPGGYAAEHRVHARAGEPCPRPRCRGTVERFRWGGRSTYACPRCQR